MQRNQLFAGSGADGDPGKPDAKKPVAGKPKPAVPAWQNLTANVRKMPLVYNWYFPKGGPPLPKSEMNMAKKK